MKGDVFCQQPDCVVSGEENLTEECPLCHEAVFCSKECKIDKRGLLIHVNSYCDKKTNYTPRSVLTRIMEAIENSDPAKRDLLERYKMGVEEHGKGMMYLVVQDMDTACTMLNSTITDVGILMSSLAFFTPMEKLNPSLRERGYDLLLQDDEATDDFFLISIHAERQGSVIHKIK